MLRSLIAMTAVALVAGASQAAVVTKVVEYEFDGVKLKGFLAHDDAVKEKRPGVMVVHEWWGLNEYAKDRCKKLAELGYVAFAPDMYGDGKTTEHPDDARKMATMTRANAKVRGRAEAGLKQLKAQPNVDGDKLAAIGYCFGGTTCLQLAYAGADLKAVVTFHSAVTPIPTEAEAKAVKPKVLVCHGEADFFIKPEDVKAFRETLDKVGTKYEFVGYKDVVHSFTVPVADKANIKGMKYDKAADEDSWKCMLALFKDTLGR